jgi:hypothetical protein
VSFKERGFIPELLDVKTNSSSSSSKPEFSVKSFMYWYSSSACIAREDSGLEGLCMLQPVNSIKMQNVWRIMIS